MAALIGAITGLVLGLMQYLSLRKHSNKAIMWVLASTLAWVVTACAIVVTIYMLIQANVSLGIDPIGTQVLYGVLIGIFAGATTGSALVAIL